MIFIMGVCACRFFFFLIIFSLTLRLAEQLSCFFFPHRDRLEQLERQRERERKLREQQQKEQREQREQKERERRAEERRKERETRREGSSEIHFL